MPLDAALSYVPVFVLVLFRVAGFMLFAPLFGSARIPKRVRTMLAVILAMGMTSSVKQPPQLPGDYFSLAMVIGGEICFGLAMGMILSFTFIAAQWAGDIIGQQLGLNISETFDPQFGQQGSLVGNLYFMLCIVIFISVNGPRALLMGVRASFDTLPLLSVGMTRPLLELFVGLFQASTELAFKLAAPVLVTLLAVDLALGFVGKTMPQLNVMNMGLSIRSLVGLIVLIVGMGLTSSVLRNALWDGMEAVLQAYSPTQVTAN